MKALLRLFGFPLTLITADTMVLDRWRWLKRRLGTPINSEKLLEVGCGSGAFTIGASRLGYRATGLSWDIRNQDVAAERAAVCHAVHAHFSVQDVRRLGDEHPQARYDVVICLECIEHILDDQKLMRDLSQCLKPGARLLLTTPNINYRPLNRDDNGPWSTVEDGGHVRKGYSEARLREMCENSDLVVEEISYCSGFISQKLTAAWRFTSRLNRPAAWILILPFRILPLILDRWLSQVTQWPSYSICLQARRETK